MSLSMHSISHGGSILKEDVSHAGRTVLIVIDGVVVVVVDVDDDVDVDVDESGNVCV